MKRRLLRWLVILLFVAPLLLIIGAGAWLLYERGWLWLLWILMGCWALAGVVWGWVGLWRRPKIVPLAHLTDQDEAAGRIITAHANRVEAILRDRPEDMLTAELYLHVAVDMAREMDKHYQPDAKAPFESVSLLEVVAAAELVIHDVARLVEDTVLGSHLMTLGQLRRLMGLSKVYQKASTAWSFMSALWSLPRAAINYALSKLGGSFLFRRVRENVLGYLYVLYVQRVGHYLVEMYSGRLRGGAAAYLRLTRGAAETAGMEAFIGSADKPVEGEGELKIAVVGQVKAGKSSLINALLGEAKAKADVVPTTRAVSGYRLQSAASAETLVLLDTPGYAEGGPDRDALEAIAEAMQDAAMSVLVLHAANPARDPDLQLLRRLDEWFRERPNLRRPPMLGVLSHIDQLKPVLEWEPPYEGWLDTAPTRAKERSIHNAVEYTREALSPFLDAGLIPVCTEPSRIYGVEEWLLPAMTSLLPVARAKRMVDLLHAAGKRRGFSLDTLLQTARHLADVGFGAFSFSRKKKTEAQAGTDG